MHLCKSVIVDFAVPSQGVRPICRPACFNVLRLRLNAVVMCLAFDCAWVIIRRFQESDFMRMIVLALTACFSIATGASADPFAPPPANRAAANVNVVNDPILNSYQKRETNADCTSSTCNLVFPKVTQARVVITHVSCTIALPSSSAGILSAALVNNAGESNFLQTFAGASFDGAYYAGANTSAYLFFDKGDVPKINIETVGGASGGSDCTISGYHT